MPYARAAQGLSMGRPRPLTEALAEVSGLAQRIGKPRFRIWRKRP